MHIQPLLVPLLAPLSSALRSSGNGKLAQPEQATKRVAIIGAGAAGASTAYHLSQYATSANISFDITVFERNSRVGGRTTTVPAWSDPSIPIELGGSIFVSVNQILVKAAQTFNLSTSALESKREVPPEVPELGVWNGKEFVIVTRAEDGWWDKAKLLWRYGLAPIKTNSLMKETVGKFLKMYDDVFPWENLTEVVEKVGLSAVTSHTGEQFLKMSGIGEKFAREIIQASTRVNYASNLGLIHGLETMVCMATSGAMAILGGNWQIFSHMLSSSPQTTLNLNTAVTTLQKQPDNTWTLTTSTALIRTYDTVILASPLQHSSLSILYGPKHLPDSIPYVSLHVTLFASPHLLSPTAFNLSADSKTPIPQYVLTTLPEGEDLGSSPDGVGTPRYFSISLLRTSSNPHSNPPGRKEYIYKIFSPHPITSANLTHFLAHDIPTLNPDTDDPTKEGEVKGLDPNGPVTWLYRKLWQSYPYEYPRVTFEEIKLDDGLWYTSGIESFISTMETSALMGKNVARLVVDEWKAGRRSSPGQDGEEEPRRKIGGIRVDPELEEELKVLFGEEEDLQFQGAGANEVQEPLES